MDKSTKDEIKVAKLALFEKIKSFLIANYEPVKDPRDPHVCFMATWEIYQKVFSFFPSKVYKSDDIAMLLNENGFSFFDMGDMKLEWMLKAKPTSNEE